MSASTCEDTLALLCDVRTAQRCFVTRTSQIFTLFWSPNPREGIALQEAGT